MPAKRLFFDLLFNSDALKIRVASLRLEANVAAQLESLAAETRKRFAGRPSGFVALRMDEIVGLWLTIRSFEKAYSPGAKPGEAGAEDPPFTLHAAIEPAAKARERLRKAIAELESLADASGSTPKYKGLADVVRPLLEGYGAQKNGGTKECPRPKANTGE